MADPTKIQPCHANTATVVAVAERHWTSPIPDEFLPLFEAAGLVIDDNDHTVIAYRSGRKVGAVWGPAVEGDWFVYLDQAPAVRVANRTVGLRYLLGAEAVA